MVFSHCALPQTNPPYLTHLPSRWLRGRAAWPPQTSSWSYSFLSHEDIVQYRILTPMTGKPNYSKTSHPLLSCVSRGTDSSCGPTFPGRSSPWRVPLPTLGTTLRPAWPAQPQHPRDFTPPPEHTQLLLGKALQKGQPRQQTARQLFLCLPALFTLSNTQPNSHIKLQKNQLGPLSHGINQKSCHIKKCYEISRGDKGKGKLKGSSCAGHLKT